MFTSIKSKFTYRETDICNKKIWYPNAAKALLSLIVLQAKGVQPIDAYPYSCSDCNGYHISANKADCPSKGKWQTNRIIKRLMD